MSAPLGFDVADTIKAEGGSRWKQYAAIAAGAVGLGALVWYVFFRKRPPIVYGSGGEVLGREARTVEELVSTPIDTPVPLLQTPEVHLELGRSPCEDLLIKYNGASRSHPELAAKFKEEARAAGCGWAQTKDQPRIL